MLSAATGTACAPAVGPSTPPPTPATSGPAGRAATGLPTVRAEVTAVLAQRAAHLRRDHPRTTWSYTVDDVRSDGALLVVTAGLAVAVDGAAAPLAGQRRVTLARGADGGWTVRADQAVGAALPWDLGSVRVTRGERSTVLTVGEAPQDDRELAGEADVAVRTVTAAWGPGWAGLATVLAVDGPADLAALLGRRPDQVSGLAAVATDVAVAVDVAALGGLGAAGRRVLLAHEVTHLASGAAADTAVPVWLEEGFADEVALAGSPVPMATVAGPLLDRVRARGLPATLPADVAFEPGRGDLGAAYAGAWLACRTLVERYGLPALVRVYRTAAAGDDTAAANLDAALSSELGITTDRLTVLWRQDLARLAR